MNQNSSPDVSFKAFLERKGCAVAKSNPGRPSAEDTADLQRIEMLREADSDDVLAGFLRKMEIIGIVIRKSERLERGERGLGLSKFGKQFGTGLSTIKKFVQMKGHLDGAETWARTKLLVEAKKEPKLTWRMYYNHVFPQRHEVEDEGVVRHYGKKDVGGDSPAVAENAHLRQRVAELEAALEIAGQQCREERAAKEEAERERDEARAELQLMFGPANPQQEDVAELVPIGYRAVLIQPRGGGPTELHDSGEFEAALELVERHAAMPDHAARIVPILQTGGAAVSGRHPFAETGAPIWESLSLRRDAMRLESARPTPTTASNRF